MINKLRRVSFRRIRQSFPTVLSGLLLGGLVGSPSLYAVDYTWLGTTTNWSTPGNWGGTVPTATDNAVFTGTFANQPTLTIAVPVGGVWLTGTLGQNVTIGGAFNLNIYGNTINGISGLGILVDNTDARTLTISANAQLQGAQTWMNSSANLFTVSGLTQTNAKALTLSNTGAGGTTLSGVINGSGAITISNTGTGVTTFSNTGDTYTGQLTVAAGTLKIDTFNNSGSNGELGNASTAVILGAAGGTNGTIEYTGSGGSSNKALSLVTGGGGTIQVDTASAGLTLTGTISGGGSLTKTGAGALYLQGTNSSNGGLNINNGTVSVSGSGPLGAGVVTVNSGGVIQSTNNNTGPSAGYVFNGGTYDGIANNSNYTGQGNVTVGTGGGTFISDTSGGNSYESYTFGTLSIGTGTLTAKTQNSQGGGVGGTGNITFGAVTLTGNPTFSTAASTAGLASSIGNTSIALNLGALGDGTIARTITFSGVSTINVNNAATSLVNGTQVNVTSGTVNAGNATSFGSLAAVSVSSSATLSLGAAETFGSLAGAGSVATNNNTLTVGSATNNLSSSFSGVIGSGTGGLIKAGTGSLTLSGANSYTGTTTVAGGTLLVGANAPSGSVGPLGNTTSDVLLGATSGAVSAGLLTNGAFTVGRNITVQSGNTGVETLGGNTAAASIFSGNVTLGTAAGTAKGVTLDALAGGTATFSGLVQQNVALSGVTVGDATHSGTVVLSNTANTYTGVTSVTNGATLETRLLTTGGSNSSIGASTSAATNLVLDGGTLKYTGTPAASTDRLFTVTANGGSIDASGASNVALQFTNTGSVVASGTGNRTLTLTGTSTGANTLSSVVANPTSGATALSKTGGGQWLVSGSNSFSGGTTVSAGTLSVASNTALGSGAVNLTGGTLKLAGTVTTNAIGIKLGVGGNGAPALTAGTSYGVVPILGSNFNSYSGTSLGAQSGTLKDSNGTANVATLSSFTAPSTYGTGSSNAFLNGYIDNTGGTENVVVSNIPYANYSVYAYFGADASGRTGSVNIGSTTYYYSTLGNTTAYTQTTSTSSGTTPGADYAIFGGLTSSTFTLSQFRGNNNNGLEGLEIVSFVTNATVMANAVNLTNDSTIDVTGANGGTISGGLTIDTHTLSVTGGSTGTNAAYSLALGGVTLAGSPTFNVANNGSGTGTLTVGAFNDGGTAQNVTKSGAGTMTLGTAATSLVDGTQINVTGGTLNSNNATALGSLAAVSISSGATLNTGASQTFGSIAGGGGVGIGANTLTIGNTNNLSASFAGNITGTGNVTKAGNGTQTFASANGYTGTTTVNGGTLSAVATNALGSTTGLVVNGGNLSLGGGGTVNRVNDTTGIALNGGTISAVATSQEGAAATVTAGGAPVGMSAVGLGALTLNANSTLDFDADSNGNLMVFNSFSDASGSIISVTNFTNMNFDGTAYSGLSTDDRLVFKQDMTAYLPFFDFGAGAGVGVTQIQLDSGFFEIDAITAVPETSTWVGAVLLVGLAGWKVRRKLRFGF